MRSYRFRLNGKGFRHTWEKECRLNDALKHAEQVARECEKDATYDEAAIRVVDDAGKEVAVLPVTKSVERPERNL
jgi:hypothetical protein